ncbi:hypothetical protein V3C99_008157 [Haemonchus contortus]
MSTGQYDRARCWTIQKELENQKKQALTGTVYASWKLQFTNERAALFNQYWYPLRQRPEKRFESHGLCEDACVHRKVYEDIVNKEYFSEILAVPVGYVNVIE